MHYIQEYPENLTIVMIFVVFEIFEFLFLIIECVI